MASWIKMRSDLAGDPAVIGIAARLGMDDDHVVGKLHKIWAWADAQTPDGAVPGVGVQWVDKYLGCQGFAAAMIAVGWLVETDGGIEFPRFDKHNGQSAKRRAENTERARSVRTACAQRAQKSVTNAHGKRDQIREDKRRAEETCLPASTPNSNSSDLPAQRAGVFSGGAEAGRQAKAPPPEQPPPTVEAWCAVHRIGGKMRDHVLETPGVTVAALEAERVAALSNATNPPAAAVHRVCDALGRAPPKGVRSRITPDVLKLQQIVYDRNNRRQQA